MSSPVPDPIAALVSFLRDDAKLTALVGTRVYGGELPDSQSVSMPRPSVVLRPSGGGVMFGASYLELGDVRIDATCYGPTPYDAGLVSRTLYPALKQMRRNVQGVCLLHWAAPTGSPMSLRDPDTEWPMVLSVWQVLVSEREVG